MVRGETRARSGLNTFLLASSALVWASAVIVMGILAYYVANDFRNTRIIYSLVIVSPRGSLNSDISQIWNFPERMS